MAAPVPEIMDIPSYTHTSMSACTIYNIIIIEGGM
jgi:hypothetical protein